mmetsp:Transcript_76321/g.182684  ORF Transcript_76321/g.182684 Transcript_76321/m.182684 type:complete len:258 (-) Transcript_76321:781-1554(-)
MFRTEADLTAPCSWRINDAIADGSPLTTWPAAFGPLFPISITAVLGTHLLIAGLHISCGAKTLFPAVGSGGRDVAQTIGDASAARFRASLPFVPIGPHTVDRTGFLTTQLLLLVLSVTRSSAGRFLHKPLPCARSPQRDVAPTSLTAVRPMAPIAPTAVHRANFFCARHLLLQRFTARSATAFLFHQDFAFSQTCAVATSHRTGFPVAPVRKHAIRWACLDVANLFVLSGSFAFFAIGNSSFCYGPAPQLHSASTGG